MKNNYLNLTSFKDIITWLLNMRNDDIRSNFCIIRAQLVNHSVDTCPPNELASFGQNLAENLRDSDLVASDGTVFWCLLPTDNVEAIQKRLATIVGMAAKKNITRADYTLSSYLFPRYSLQRIKSGETLLETISSASGIIPDKQLELNVLADGKSEVVFVPLFSK